MNNEMKRLLSRFLFISVIICCFGLLLSGSITAREKSERNTFDRAYTVMSLSLDSRELTLSLGERELSLSTPEAYKIKEYEDYIILTPLSCVYYFFSCLEKVIS